MTIPLLRPDLGEGLLACFTGRELDRAAPEVGDAGNLAHRRPHRPADLAAARREVADAIGVPTDAWHLMHQVHGPQVGIVDEATTAGAELREVDAIVTRQAGRALVVQVADCVPVLLGGDRAIAAVHAGRAGVATGVLARTLEELESLGQPVAALSAVVGPAIGGCCYEVPERMRDELADRVPEARATTRWGTPSLDLPAAVGAQLAAAGVTEVRQLGLCTFEDERFFSHRRDAAGGRQVGIVYRGRAS